MARKGTATEVEALEENKIIRVAMKERGVVQVELAKRLGILQSSLSGNINRTRMSLDVFNTMLNAMDYDVAVVDRTTGEVKWKVVVK